MLNGKTCIFADSTLSHEHILEIIPSIQCKPAVKKGDVLRALSEGVKNIIIIDGNFDLCPSVWHKEILFALKQSITVIGAASMGALRASELHDYGMVGFGKIFDLYRENKIVADDELVVMHSANLPEKTLPLINIRLSIQRLPQLLQDNILSKAKNIYFKRRTWRQLKANLDLNEFTQLKQIYIDYKRLDAINCLRWLNGCSELKTLPKREIIYDTHFFNKLVDDVIYDNNLFPFEYSFEKVKPEKSICERAKRLIVFLNINHSLEVIDYFSNLISILASSHYSLTSFAKHEIFNEFRKKCGLLTADSLKHHLSVCNIKLEYLDQLVSDYCAIRHFTLYQKIMRENFERQYCFDH